MCEIFDGKLICERSSSLSIEGMDLGRLVGLLSPEIAREEPGLVGWLLPTTDSELRLAVILWSVGFPAPLK